MKIVYSARAREQIRRLPPQTKPLLKQRLEELKVNPYLGKALRWELSVYRSLRYKNYRIIYECDELRREVRIARVGERKDIYDETAREFGK